MSEIINLLKKQMDENNIHFANKPILIGGMAMEYYGIRKAGADIDIVVHNDDYQTLASNNPDRRKDLWGDLGVVIEPFEIWRSIARFDYDFFKENAVDEEIALVVSLDRLLFMKIIAVDYGASEKSKNDLQLVKEYYYKQFVNQDFYKNMEKNMSSYEKNNGIIFGGKYQ